MSKKKIRSFQDFFENYISFVGSKKSPWFIVSYYKIKQPHDPDVRMEDLPRTVNVMESISSEYGTRAEAREMAKYFKRRHKTSDEGKKLYSRVVKNLYISGNF